VNLDGLINDFELIEYIEAGRVHEYIVEERIDYLSDMESMFDRFGLTERLVLTEVYRHPTGFRGEDYVIYRVDGLRASG
jgi:hypothetical protein